MSCKCLDEKCPLEIDGESGLRRMDEFTISPSN